MVSARFNSNADLGFAIKSELKKRPLIVLGFMMMVVILYLGFAIRTFEM